MRLKTKPFGYFSFWSLESKDGTVSKDATQLTDNVLTDSNDKLCASSINDPQNPCKGIDKQSDERSIICGEEENDALEKALKTYARVTAKLEYPQVNVEQFNQICLGGGQWIFATDKVVAFYMFD